MPLFVCDKCNGIDNTACGGNYWDRLVKDDGNKETSRMILCCECYTGRWHEQFTKRIFDPTTANPANYCYIPAKLKKLALKPRPYRVVFLPNGVPFKCKPSGRICQVREIADGGLFEHDGDIWEKLPDSCANLSDLNDESEVIGIVKVVEYQEFK